MLLLCVSNTTELHQKKRGEDCLPAHVLLPRWRHFSRTSFSVIPFGIGEDWEFSRGRVGSAESGTPLCVVFVAAHCDPLILGHLNHVAWCWEASKILNCRRFFIQAVIKWAAFARHILFLHLATSVETFWADANSRTFFVAAELPPTFPGQLAALTSSFTSELWRRAEVAIFSRMQWVIAVQVHGVAASNHSSAFEGMKTVPPYPSRT